MPSIKVNDAFTIFYEAPSDKPDEMRIAVVSTTNCGIDGILLNNDDAVVSYEIADDYESATKLAEEFLKDPTIFEEEYTNWN